jgi:alkylresorcinol/alkylpyrone synthase
VTDVHLLGVGRAVPERSYTQAALYAHNPWPQSGLLDRLFLDSAVASRALFVPPEWWDEARTLSETNAAWKAGALLLARSALEEVLERTSTAAAALDFLGVTTVTGYTTPGLDLLLARDLGLRRDLARAHFNNVGCHAAVPLLRVAADHARVHPGSRAAAVAVEVCSACFSPENADPQSQVAASLFADGAAAAVLSTHGDGPVVIDFASAFDYAHLDALGFALGTGGFRIVLDPSIPDHIGASVGGLVDELLARHRVTRDRVSVWALHPGGARILDAAGRALALTDVDLEPSRRVLRSYGNMSSPSVLFVLAEAMAEGRHRPGSYGVIAAFGPGLGIEAALLRF